MADASIVPFQRRYLRHGRRILFAVDLLLVLLAFNTTFLLIYGAEAAWRGLPAVAAFSLAMTAISAVMFPALDLYGKQWRYASLTDLLAITRAVLASAAVFALTRVVEPRFAAIPLEFLAVHSVLLVGMIGATRLSLRRGILHRLLQERLGSQDAHAKDELTPILLVGAGDAADVYMRALSGSADATHEPVGLIDDDPSAIGLTVRGVPVLGTLDQLPQAISFLRMRGRAPHHIVFTRPPSSFGAGAERLVNDADAAGLAVSCLASPTAFQAASGEQAPELRRIELSDLLRRPQAVLDKTALKEVVGGAVVAVTGAGGSIGSELVRQIAALGPAEVVLIDHGEFNLYSIDAEFDGALAGVPRTSYVCDVRDARRVNEILARHRPRIVFNAAALKHVPMVELNPCEGALTNAIGTRNVADAALACGAAAMVQVSTDKAVDSASVMGATKRLGELYCQALDLAGSSDPGRTRFMTVRFGNVLGSSGSLIPLFQKQLKRGGPLTVTHPDMTRFFMTVREAVELTLQASARGLTAGLGRGEIFVLDMGEPIRILDIARRMIRLAGRDVDEVGIEIIGCRPGEKLFEELFGQDERRVPSGIPGVNSALSAPRDPVGLQEQLSAIEDAARAGDAQGLFDVLESVLPHYHPEVVARTGAPGTSGRPARTDRPAPGRSGAAAGHGHAAELAG